MVPIQFLDGRNFRQAIVAGADWVRHTREQINRINVFPVPDGDTGTNMALSLSATASAVRAVDEPHLGEVSRLAAEASILGAKGNSGVIMAHWFLGLASSFSEEPRLSASDVAPALKAASDSVYSAVENPVEGTIVTVMRSVGDAALEKAAAERVHLGELMESLFDAAAIALARTPDQLAVLREANVVDAGAQGYVNFLEGALRAVRGEPLPRPSDADLREAVEQVAFEHDTSDLSERYCTEVVVRGKRFESERLKTLFRPLGSSLLVATTGNLFKLHLHTNHPDEVLRVAARQGSIEEQKVDDMLRQRDERGEERQRPVVALEAQPDTVAILCDSTADLPEPVRREHGIEMAPLQVLFGDRVYRDQVDLSTDEFYRLLRSDPHHPTTSQPPPRAFVEALDRIRSDRPAIIVTVSRGVSGTYTSAQSGAALAPHPRVEVFDSRSASLGLGMMTLNAARLASRGAEVAEILSWLGRWREDSGLVISLATLEFLRRGGRIGAAKSLIGGLLGLRPIIADKDGKIVPVANARGDE
ncbi:MAG TPA: DegV family protein, partial [Gammaproteobacteria bacterium]|nr:DegV family protein [Gammaproteobacteria bacterium]